MKANKRLLIISGALTIIMIAGFFFYSQQSDSPDHTPVDLSGESVSVDTVNPDVNLSEAPSEAVTQHNAVNSKSIICESMKASYGNIEEVKKKEKVEIRFVNTHKKVDGIVYRLRYFLKDSSESEIPTYLVYKENQNDEDILTEKSTYKKGKLYNRIEKSTGEIIHSEEAINIGLEQDMFLHYENKVLKDLQGISPLPDVKDFIECRF